MNAENIQELHAACAEGNLKEVKRIESTIGLPLSSVHDATNFTPLHAASMFGRVDVVKYLLQQGLSPLAQTETPLYTPVHSAAYGGHLDCVRMLVEKEPNTKTMQNYRGETPADTARRTGKLEVSKYLDSL